MNSTGEQWQIGVEQQKREKNRSMEEIYWVFWESVLCSFIGFSWMQILSPPATLFEQNLFLPSFAFEENCSLLKQIIDLRSKQPFILHSLCLSLSLSLSICFFISLDISLFFFPILLLHLAILSLSPYIMFQCILQHFQQNLEFERVCCLINEPNVKYTCVLTSSAHLYKMCFLPWLSIVNETTAGWCVLTCSFRFLA